MDSAEQPNMACHQVSEAEPAVQEEARVIGYFDLENSGLQLVEGDNTFYLPPEALGEHVLMSEEGKEGQNIIVVLEGSEDDVVEALARNSETLLGDQATFTVNQLENAISATLPQEFAGVEAVTTTEGQQLLILSEDTSEKMASVEGAPVESAAVLETPLLYQEASKGNPPRECAAEGTSVQAELEAGFEQSREVSGKERTNVILEDCCNKMGAVCPLQQSSGFQSESRSVPLATSPLCVRESSDGTDSFRISISLAQCGSLGHRKNVSPGIIRAEGTGEEQNGTVGADIVRINDKHSSHKSMSSAQAREPAIGVDLSTSKMPPAASAVSGRLDPANIPVADEVIKENETAEFAVQKDVDITETEGGTEALDLAHTPQRTSEHVTADPSTARIPENRSDEPAQVGPTGLTTELEKAAEKGLSSEPFKSLSDSESVASKPLPASESISYIQGGSGITIVVQENLEKSVGQDAATLTTEATLHTYSERGLPVTHEAVEAASNRGTVASSTRGHQRHSCDENSGLVSALKPKNHEKKAKRHLTASEKSKQFHDEYFPSVKHENAAHEPPEKCNSRTRAGSDDAREEISFPPFTTTAQSNLRVQDKRKDPVIKPAAVTQKERCQTSYGIDAYDFDEHGGNTPPVKDLPLQKREQITEADISEEQKEKSQEVRKAIEGEQNADIVKSNINMEYQQGVSQQLLGEETHSEKPSTAAEYNAEKSLDLPPKPTQLEAQDRSSSDMEICEIPNKQEGTACDPASSSLTASKLENSLAINSREVSQSNVLENHQEASRDMDAVSALKSTPDLAEEQNATHPLRSLSIDCDEKLQETEARNIDSVCDKAAFDSLNSQELEREHSKRAHKVSDNTRDSQSRSVEFRDMCGEPIEDSEASNRELQEKEGDNCDIIDKGSRIVQALSPPEGNELNAKEGVCAEGSDEKLFAALDLVPCQESSQPPASIAVNSSPPAKKLDVETEKPGPSSAASGSLDEKKRKKEKKRESSFRKPGLSSTSDAVEKRDDQEGSSVGKKRWSLRTPTKPRKRFFIPDSDDEDFDAYESEDVSTEAQKSKSEEAFDVLLNVFKTEQAKKAANHGEPTGKKNAKKGGLSCPKRKPPSKSFGGGDGAVGKEGVTSGTEKFKAKEKPPIRKSHPVDMPSFATNEAPAPKRAQKRRSEPVKPVASKKSAGGDTTTKTPFTGNRIPSVTELFAGDIRIRCQKPSFSNDKAATNYHCSKCGFRSTRMENIVRHHKQDCPYSKSLFEWDNEPSKSTNNNAPT